MNVVCLGCGRIAEPVFDVTDQRGKDGSLCRRCELSASSRLEILAIGGRQFVRTLKRGPVAVEPKKAKTPAGTGALIRKEA